MVGSFACKEATELVTTGVDYVAFSAASVSLPESSLTTTQDGAASVTNNSTEITVIRSSSDVSADLTVNFTITSEFTSTTAFADAGDDAASTFQVSDDGTVIIPAGKGSASFTITSINDLFSSGNKALTLTITGTSNSNLQLGYKDGGLTSDLSLTIVDDDCPIDIDDWVGTYTVEEAFTTVNDPNGLSFFFGESYQMEFALDATDATGTQVIASNSAGFDEYMPDGTVIKFVTCDKSVEFDGGTVVSIAVFFSPDFSVTNSYDEAALSITCSATATGFGDYGFTLTKQ